MLKKTTLPAYKAGGSINSFTTLPLLDDFRTNFFTEKIIIF